MTNFVRSKETNIVEYAGGLGSFTAAGADHFTIDEATAEWGLPNPGWDNDSREGISVEIEIPEGFAVGTSKLVGTDGNYSIELS